MPRAPYATCTTCQSPTKKADTLRCAGCGQTFCPSHIFYYVDGNNAAITKNSPPRCKPCAVKEGWD